MKRCYLGVAMLLILLLFGTVSSRWMEKHHALLEQRLLMAAQQDPETLMTLAEQARRDWNRGLAAVLADHQYLDRAEEAFDLLDSAVRRRDGAECTSLCLEIAHIFRLLSEEQRLKWENLL